MKNEWIGFEKGIWTEEVNVRDFIQKNYTPYYGDEKFLCKATERTNRLWKKIEKLLKIREKYSSCKFYVLNIVTDNS